MENIDELKICFDNNLRISYSLNNEKEQLKKVSLKELKDLYRRLYKIEAKLQLLATIQSYFDSIDRGNYVKG